jgi:hypothetical protein
VRGLGGILVFLLFSCSGLDFVVLAFSDADSEGWVFEVEIEGVSDEESLTISPELDAVDMDVLFLKRSMEKAVAAGVVE